MARWRPLSDARWGAPIVRELGVIATVASISTYLVVVVLGVALAGREVTDPLVQALAAVGCVGAAAVVAIVGVRRRVVPLFESVEWALAMARSRWATLGFERGMLAPEEGLAALQGRTDELSLSARAAALAGLGRTLELDDLLEGWTADTPTAAAAIARHKVNLDSLRGRPADPAAALSAAAGIPDATARANATALVHIDTANREARAGRSPEPALRAARAVIQPGPGDDRPFARNIGLMTLWLTVVACGTPVAVATLIVGGVIGLAVWVGVVAIVVLGSRFAGRARAAPR